MQNAAENNCTFKQIMEQIASITKCVGTVDMTAWNQLKQIRQRYLLNCQLTFSGASCFFCRRTSFSSSSYTISVINCNKKAVHTWF